MDEWQNSVDPDEILHSEAAHLGLHCLFRPVYLNTYGKYGTSLIFLYVKDIKKYVLSYTTYVRGTIVT